MIRRLPRTSLLAAGLVALAGATRPAAAHQAAAPPRHAEPAAPQPITGEPDPHASSGVRSLRELSEDGRATVVGRVSQTDTYDGGKLLVYRVTVERVLRGVAPASPAAIVDVRAGLTRPPHVTDGQRAVLMLQPAPALSYLSQQLPGESPLYELVRGRDGVVPVATDADVDRVLALLEAGDRVRAAPDNDTRQRELRALAFALLATDQPRLAADGLLELRRVSGAIELTSEEVAVLGRVLRDTGIPVATRIGLLRLLGQRHWAGAVAALQSAAVDHPDVLAALLAARADLGAPATRADLTPYLTSDDPAVQAAAVAALARTSDPGTIDELGRWATTEGDLGVRESAIAALGRSKRPEASRYLQQTFASPERRVRQASARALLDLDEADGSAALIELALRGTETNVRTYAALLLVTTRGKDAPAVQQLRARTSDPQVTYVLEHGLEMRGAHHHED